MNRGALKKMTAEALCDNSPEATFLLTPKGALLYMNIAAGEMLGYSRKEAAALHWNDIESGSDFSRILEKESLCRESVLKRKDGSTLPSEIVCREIVDGEERAVAVYARDITPRVDKEREIRGYKKEINDIIEFFPDATFIISSEREVIGWNRATEEMTGVAREEVIGRGDYAYAIPFYGERIPILVDFIFSPPDEMPERYSTIEKHGDTLYAEAYVSSLYGGKGGYIRIAASPLYDEDGAIIASIETAHDITGLREAKEALTQKNNELEDSLSELHCLFGITDLIERSLSERDVFSSTADLIRSNLKDPAEEVCLTIDGAIFSSGETEEDKSTFRRSIIVRRKKRGEIRIFGPAPENTEKEERIKALLFEISHILGRFIGQKETENALSESEERLKLAVEGANIGIWDWDIRHKKEILATQWARLLGYTPEEFEGRQQVWKSLVHPDDLTAAMIAGEDHLKGRTSSYSATYRMKAADGGWRWVQSRGRVVRRDKSGRPMRMIGIIQDFTEIQRNREAIREANRKLQLLSGITRHDILNQITGISGYNELVEEIVQNDEEASGYVQKIEQLTKTIEKQISFTRDYEELGMHQPEWQRIDEIVHSAAKDYPGGIAKIEVDCDDVEIFADQMLEKVFFNLIDNALRHGETVTKIRISISEIPEGGVISVEDDGRGIPAGEKEAIFRRGVGSHTGYGLFLAREILEITGMTIAECGTPGKGARFEIRVPAHNIRYSSKSD